MGDSSDKEIARALAELLAVVKVAIPSGLFQVDPRVLKARQLLAKLAQVPITDLLRS